MPSFIQRSFASGVVSPALFGRADQAKYQNGLKQCENFIVQRHGSVTNRPGWEYIVRGKDAATNKCRLIKFIYNDDQTYIIELGDYFARYLSGGEPVTVSGASIYDAATTYAQGNLVFYAGDIYYSRVSSNLGNTPSTSTAQWRAMVEVTESVGPDIALEEVIFETDSPYPHSVVDDLRYVQSADVVTICHNDYPVYELRRTGNTAWTFTQKTYNPLTAAPTGVVATPPVGANTYKYVVTTVDSVTSEESLASSIATAALAAVPTSAAPIVITWNAVSGAAEYYVYKELNGVYGFIGIAIGTTFNDINYTPITSETPPVSQTLFASTGNYPSTAIYHQQRLIFGNTDNDPEDVWTSRTGNFKNFTKSSPIQDDDAFQFTIAGTRVNEVRHLFELGKLLILTSGGVWLVRGDAEGVLTPTSINLAQQAGQGSGTLPPLLVGDSGLYVQARGAIVRDLRYDYQSDGYTGNDLTIFAPHLFRGYSITDWDYQELPESVVWMVRSDGTLLACTYLRDQQVLAWHTHTTDGIYEHVAVIPEGDEDRVYASILRTVNGTQVRHIERMATRHISDMATDARFSDAHIAIDGTNTGTTTLTISGGTTWSNTEDLTLTASASLFAASDATNGNAFQLTIGGVTVTMTVLAFSSALSVTARADINVPVAFQSVATTSWAKALRVVTGLSYLEAATVTILGDGNVDPVQVVSGGSITLSRPFVKLCIGLPYTSTMELLDIELPDNETFKDHVVRLSRATVQVEAIRGLFIGPDEDHLREAKQRSGEAWGVATEAFTGSIDVALDSTYSRSTALTIQQPYPLPMTILGVVRHGTIGGKV